MELQLLPNFQNLFQYQKDAIQKGIQNIVRANVHAEHTMTGLGKTIICGTIAVNVADGGGEILVVSPKALQNAWKKAMEGIGNVYICTKAKIRESKYSCIIVDEAHHFQNTTNKSYMSLFRIVAESKCPVILSTATPYQNSIEGLVAMYGLGWFLQSSLPFQVLGELGNIAMDCQKKLQTLERFHSSDTYGLMDSFSAIGKHVGIRHQLMHTINAFGRVVGTFSNRYVWEAIAKDFPEDMDAMGGFPERISLDVEYAPNYIGILAETEKAIDSFRLPLHKSNENNMALGALFRTFLFKRLDSSASSFVSSILSYRDKLIFSESNEENSEAIVSDIALCDSLVALWKDATDSEKVSALMERVRNVGGNEKIIVFSEYRDSAKMAFDALSNEFGGVMYYDGESPEKDLEAIIDSFDPSSDKKGKGMILVCTDALSEGVSLHNASHLMHFDMKWNPQRMVQRDGRINRIGNMNKKVHIYTFSVPSVLENILKLEARIESKETMASIFIEGSATPIELDRYDGLPWGKICKSDNSETGEDSVKRIVVCRTSEGDVAVEHFLFSLFDTQRDSGIITDLGNLVFCTVEKKEGETLPYTYDPFDYDFRVGGFGTRQRLAHLYHNYIIDKERKRVKVKDRMLTRMLNRLYSKSCYSIMDSIVKGTAKTDGRFSEKMLAEIQDFYELMSEEYDGSSKIVIL